MATVTIDSDVGFSSVEHSGIVTIQVDGVTVYCSSPEQVKAKPGGYERTVIIRDDSGVAIGLGSGLNMSGASISIGNLAGRNFTQTIVQTNRNSNKGDK